MTNYLLRIRAARYRKWADGCLVSEWIYPGSGVCLQSLYSGLEVGWTQLFGLWTSKDMGTTTMTSHLLNTCWHKTWIMTHLFLLVPHQSNIVHLWCLCQKTNKTSGSHVTLLPRLQNTILQNTDFTASFSNANSWSSSIEELLVKHTVNSFNPCCSNSQPYPD
jgi:hypothetical protein